MYSSKHNTIPFHTDPYIFQTATNIAQLEIQLHSPFTHTFAQLASTTTPLTHKSSFSNPPLPTLTLVIAQSDVEISTSICVYI